MDSSEPLRLGPEHAEAALPLSVEAGWNQTAADWRIFLRHGSVFGIRSGGRLAATAAALPYEGKFGFVGMVLTTAAERHRGHATRLLALAVRSLRDSGHVAMLDATPAGRPVYEKQGFVPVDALQRWSGIAAGEPRPASADAANIAGLDAIAFGAARPWLFADMLARDGSAALLEEGGCVLLRRGQRASQIGPLVARDEVQAARLLEQALDRALGPVLLDVPVRWHGLGALLRARGFAPQRPFTRMALEHGAPFGDPARLFAATGPEFG